MRLKSILTLLCSASLLICVKSSYCKTTISLKGNLDFNEKSLNLFFESEDKGSMGVKARQLSKGQYGFYLNPEHLKTPFFDITSQIKCVVDTLEIGSEKNKVFSGKMSSQYSLIDYKPVPELSSRFEFNKGRLNISSFSYANVKVNGFVDFISPFEFDLVVDLCSVEMDDFLDFWVSDKGYKAQGDVSGKIKISGKIDRFFLEGALNANKGEIQELSYDNLQLNISGYYPEMNIAKSLISQNNGLSFLYYGPFNLKDHENFRKQINSLNLSPVIKSKDGEIEWTLKQKKDMTGTTELKYQLRGRDEKGISDDEDSGMFSIEKKIEF